MPRLRIGIGERRPAWRRGRFRAGQVYARQELPAIDEAIVRAADAVETWAREGMQTA